jgi:hypothetical protein
MNRVFPVHGRNLTVTAVWRRLPKPGTRGMPGASLSERLVAMEGSGVEDGGMRRAMLAVLGVDVVLVAAGVIGYPSFLNQRGSAAYLTEPTVLLAVYAVVALAAIRPASADRRRVLRAAAMVGVALGTLEMLNISVETFAGLSGAANLATTAPLILGPFLVWSVVAGWAARATGSLRTGLLAAVCSTMLTMMIGVTYGFVLALVVPGRLARDLVNDPDYLRSGWTDVKAFVLANTFDNGFTHLLGGLIVGSVVGLIGGLIGVRLANTRLPTQHRHGDRIHQATGTPTGTESAN